MKIEYRTVKGLINHLKKLEKNTVMDLKGYDKLSKEEKEALNVIMAELSNTIGEFDATKTQRGR